MSEESPKLRQTRRLQEIRKVAETIGIWNIGIQEMADKCGVCEKTIRRDIIKIYELGIDKKCVEHAALNFDNANKALLKTLQRDFITAKTKSERVAIARAILELEDTHTKHLERFGAKDIVTPITDTHIVVEWGKDERRGTANT